MGTATLTVTQTGAVLAAARDDETLMLRIRSGETGVLAELFERHHRPLYGFFYRVTNSREMSEDLVQDVFLRILRYRDTYQPKTSFAAWMYGIARNTLIDTMRKRRPEAGFEDAGPELPAQDQSIDDHLRCRQERDLIRQALASLPADKREVLVLARYQELRYDEIGRILGCEANTVKQRVFRAVKALSERFQEISAGAS